MLAKNKFNEKFCSLEDTGPITPKSLVSIGAIILLVFYFSNAPTALAATVPPPEWLNIDPVDESKMVAETVTNDPEPFVTEEAPVTDSHIQKTFIISAYYSPQPGQSRYVTGSYAGDIRLNGGGVNGADGTPVYPGMIAAPKTYAFGTKMEIPDIGVVAVHDRGGAIVASGNKGNSYDRLDIWMGYGDAGLQRALKWGKRTVNVKVYGINENIKESVLLDNAVNEGNANNNPASGSWNSAPKPQIFARQLTIGSTGNDVAKLQKMLKEMNYYEGDVNSVFDHATYDAVSKFQVNERIVTHKTAFGAGYVGPKTMSALAGKGIATAHAEEVSTADNNAVFNQDLKPGDSGDDVKKLQIELKRFNLFGIDPSGYYGELTEHAVFKFQQINKLAGDKESPGAGIFGPVTRAKMNGIIAARIKRDELISSILSD